MLKRLVAMGLLAGLAAVLGACGGSESSPASSTAPGAIKVGLIVPGSTTDHGWNELAATSMAKVAKEKGIETLTRQQVKKDDAADAIRKFETDGYALVIAHGYEYLDAAKELSDPSKPTAVKLKIAVSGGDVDGANFQSLLYDLGPACYQLGVVAGKVSKGGKLGFIGGDQIPTVTAMQRGFEAGAKSVNPGATVTAVYTNNWDDAAKAKQAAEGLINQGVDVMIVNVDTAGLGAFEAVKENNTGSRSAEKRDVYIFGANSDQNDILPDYTLGSAVIKMDVAFATVIDAVKAGTFKPGLVKEDLANGVAVAVLNPKLTSKVIDDATQKLVEQAGKDLVSGKVKIPEK
jgi:basic membrane lipoprotein Med (substrate-binding protein (PBP1-ABC) superfamily)